MNSHLFMNSHNTGGLTTDLLYDQTTLSLECLNKLEAIFLPDINFLCDLPFIRRVLGEFHFHLIK